MLRSNSSGWFRESYRHSLASRGVRTSFKRVGLGWGKWHELATPEQIEARRLKIAAARARQEAEKKEFISEVGAEEFRKMQERKRRQAIADALDKLLGPVGPRAGPEEEQFDIARERLVVGAGEAKLAKEAAKEVEEERKKKKEEFEEEEFDFGPDMAGKRKSFTMTEDQINRQMALELQVGDAIVAGDMQKVGELRKQIRDIREESRR